jgi:ABC-type oligopeptide transport system substrate-binding subunit
MKSLAIIALLLFSLTACKQERVASGGDTSSKEENAIQGVSDCFAAYKGAILAQKGEVAVEHLSQGTIDEFQNYVNLALTADREELEALSVINRMQVILMRHRIPLDTLRGLNGRSAIVYAVDRDWIGKNAVIRTELGEVSTHDDRATAEVIIGGQKAPTRFQFRRENGTWRFDLLTVLMDGNTAMKRAAEQAGMDENEFLFNLTESVTGKKIDESIWTPPN